MAENLNRAGVTSINIASSRMENRIVHECAWTIRRDSRSHGSEASYTLGGEF